MRYALLLTLPLAISASASAQVPANIETELRKIGQIVDPACTEKLYRPLMPANDFNTYWPPDAPQAKSTAPLYPGVTIVRDQSFGPNTKDVVDIFTGEKGGERRPVVIYVPGGAGNKIEQQVREGNAFYDNIGRWATKNGMVGVLVQRHPGSGNWDDTGRDISVAVDWVHDNIAKYKGDPNHIVIWAHSAGNGPLGMYVGHPERWKNGVQVTGAIFMSGNPVPGVGGAPGGRGGGVGAPQPGVACGLTNASMTSDSGRIAGPSGFTSPQQGNTGGGRFGPGGAGAGRGGPQLTPEQQAERDNLPGFKKTPVKIAIAFAELDPGVMNATMPANVVALHDELCKLDGPAAKDGKGRCPEMWMLKGESHMSEVFSLDTSDQTVAKPVLEFVKKAK
ncbi:MAG TPA: alpha/beta hydrolase [Vicinamibacterales bacterium]|nr:alpha/beta hydrolase [Vicinamibacterales bacterium]